MYRQHRSIKGDLLTPETRLPALAFSSFTDYYVGPALGEPDLTFCDCKYKDESEVESDPIKSRRVSKGV